MKLPNDIELRILTLLFGPDAEPRVILQFVHIPTGEAMSPVALTPSEAISISSWLTQAAEVSVSDASLLMALRSRKFSEEQIAEIFQELRGRRGNGDEYETL